MRSADIVSEIRTLVEHGTREVVLTGVDITSWGADLPGAPRLGRLVTYDADSYRYLAESIRMHPDQETLKQMMERAGLERVEYFNLAAGVVALHRGIRF